MVSLETAEKALKSVYLGVVQDQLNVGVNPLLAKIQQTTSDVWGKEIIKMVPYGMNGGIGAGTEIGELPDSAGNNYKQFKLELKNLYGTIEISDKAIMASRSSAGAFVNLLNAEMEGLLKASKFNLGRMLYGDGSGTLATVTAVNSSNRVVLSSVRNVMEGMVVDFHSKDSGNVYPNRKGRRIVSIDRSGKTVTLDGSAYDAMAVGDTVTVQKSKGYEITGLGAIFSDNDIYGLKRSENEWMKPYMRSFSGNNLDTETIQRAIDYVEEVAGSNIDFIVASYDVRRKYINYANTIRLNIDFMNLDCGYKAISYNGIPLVADRFVEENAMYLLNSKDFKLHQLSDWRWLEGDGGRVIKQKAGSPCYSATLVKYADLICDKPIGQVKLTF